MDFIIPCFFIAAEVIVFFIFLIRTIGLRILIPEQAAYSVVKIPVPQEGFTDEQVKLLIKGDFRHREFVTETRPIIPILQVRSKSTSGLFEECILEITSHQVRNPSSSLDFKLVESVFERSLDAKETYVRTFLSLPLYIGLAGTITGIIISLLSMGHAGQDVNGLEMADGGIGEMISGIWPAMLSSLFGLILMVTASIIHSRFMFSLNQNKNKLYDTYQTKIIGGVSGTITSEIQNLSLQLNQFSSNFLRQLDRFHTNSTTQIDLLNNVFDKAQEIATSIKEIDLKQIKQIAKTNNEIFAHIEKTLLHLHEFTAAFKAMTEMVSESKRLTANFSAMLDRVNGITELGKGIGDRLDLSQQILDSIQHYYSSYDSRGQELQIWLSKTDASIGKSISQLATNMAGYYDQLYEVHRNAAIKINETVYQNNSLLYLEKLPEIKKSLSELEKESHQNQLQLHGIHQQIAESNRWIKKIAERIDRPNFLQRIFLFFSIRRHKTVVNE